MTKKITVAICLLFILGCSSVSESVTRHENTFNVGDFVIHKLDGKRGIITEQYFSRYHSETLYRGYVVVRFSIKQNNIHGNDTAGGSGFLGDTRHFSPSAYSTIDCYYEELELEL